MINKSRKVIKIQNKYKFYKEILRPYKLLFILTKNFNIVEKFFIYIENKKFKFKKMLLDKKFNIIKKTFLFIQKIFFIYILYKK